MFYCTNLSADELSMVMDRKTISRGQRFSDFKMNVPVRLEYISMRPNEDEGYFSMASIWPDQNYYAVTSRSELGDMLSHPTLHRHDYYELLFVLKGEVYQIIENQRHLYPTGSCCLLNQNVLHTEEHETEFEVAFLGISDTLLSELKHELSHGFFAIEKERPPREVDTFISESLSGGSTYEKKYIDFIPCGDPDGLDRMRSLFERMAAEFLNPHIGSSHIIRGLIAEIICLLADPTIYRTTPVQIGTDAENQLYNEIDRIMHDTQGRATRSFLEEELHYSGDYLNKITRKYTGLNIHDFGMTICMGIAADKLCLTDLTIGDIALSLGFSNRTHFYKQFEKIYHLSPAEYRKQEKK